MPSLPPHLPPGSVSAALQGSETEALRDGASFERTEEDLADFIDNASIGLHWVGSDGTILWANQAELNLLGYSADEYIGQHIARFHAEPQAIQEILCRLQQNQTLHNYEARLLAKDGSIKHVLINSNVLWRNGKFVHTRCFTRDVTERVYTERQLQQSQRALAALADLSKTFAEADFDLPAIFDAITSKVVDTLGDGCVVRLLSDDEAQLRTVAAQHRDAEATELLKRIAEIPTPTDEGVTGKAFSSRQSIRHSEVNPGKFANIVGPTAREYVERFPIYSLLAVPLSVQGKLIGVIAATRHIPGEPYTENDQMLLEEISYRSALAIRGARQHQELLLQGQRLDAVLQQMPSAVAIVEAPSGKLLLANSNNESIFRQQNVPLTDVSEYARFTGLHDDGRPIQPHEWPLARSISTGEVVQGEEIHIIRGDGTHGTIRVNSAPVRDGSGKVVAGVVTFDDVSLEKRAEEQRKFLLEASVLLSSSLDYEKTLDSLARVAVPAIADFCAVDMLEPGGRVRRLSVVHKDPERLQMAVDFHAKYPTDLQAPSGVGKVLRTGEPELYLDIPDSLLAETIPDPEKLRASREFGIKSFIAVPLAARGRLLGALTIAFADSNRRYTSADLAMAEDLARRAAVSVDNCLLYRELQSASEEQKRRIELEEQLIGIVSHDLRNPLYAIGVSASVLLRRGNLDAQQAKAVTRILSSSDRAVRLIRDFLDLTRARSGSEVPLQRVRSNIHELARQVADEVHLSYSNRALSIEQQGDGSGDWDVDRMAQVIGNLLANAFQHSPPDASVRVLTRGDEAEVVVEVFNGGPGIPAESQAQLFEPFKRGGTKVSSDRSVGLGLFISKQLVEAHGGSIGMTSVPNEGVTFSVRLPREKTGAFQG